MTTPCHSFTVPHAQIGTRPIASRMPPEAATTSAVTIQKRRSMCHTWEG
jgi:hypothetical protein